MRTNGILRMGLTRYSMLMVGNAVTPLRISLNDRVPYAGHLLKIVKLI